MQNTKLKFKIFFLAILLCGFFWLSTTSILADTVAPSAPTGLMVDGGSIVAGAGVLRLHPTNPRYFTDNSGDAILLSGAHTWYNIHIGRDVMNTSYESFEDFLDWLQSHGNNYTRLWTGLGYLGGSPYPWLRTGPGLANDGELKFDMTEINQAYFDIIKERVLQMQNRGMYCSVMFFGSHNRFKLNYPQVVWYPDNHINNVDFNLSSTDPTSFFNPNAELLAAQELLVGKFLDELNDVDNVIFEVMNEANMDPNNSALPTVSVPWQKNIVTFAQEYESFLPKQHLIGITGDVHNSNSLLTSGPQDWFSPMGGIIGTETYDYRQGGPATFPGKIALIDKDHFDGGLYETTQVAQGVDLVWKTFTRGNHPVLMDCYDTAVEDSAYGCSGGGNINTVFDPIRDALGDVLSYANNFPQLANMFPSETISSTTYCLSDSNATYLAYQPLTGAFSLNLTAGTYSYEWFNTQTGLTVETGTVNASGGAKTFTPPFSGPAVLYLYR